MSTLPPFETVVETHGPTVLRVCRAVLGPDEADDAWSETFLSALRAYPELSADANVEAWLVTIAHRKAVDVTRAAARRPPPTDRPPPDRPDRGTSTERVDTLLDDVARLPRRQRQAVALHHLGGLPYVEVAGLVGVSPDAARRAAADGIAALRRSYLPAPSPERNS
ncbi:RNA polymerase sigma factor [uncultured Friedmanniella sp.]|uniref:RNA polymerase sigma factor n=1 Tax=uncultured Friedmanniella sp. TaxID=335381 RepID=UPI0035C983CF